MNLLWYHQDFQQGQNMIPSYLEDTPKLAQKRNTDHGGQTSGQLVHNGLRYVSAWQRKVSKLLENISFYSPFTKT